MAIDIVFYTKIESNLLNEELDRIKLKYYKYFDYRYVLYKAHKVLTHEELFLVQDKAERYSEESSILLSEEYGLYHPKSSFMMSLNDKTYTDIFPEELAKLIKKELGGKDIIAILNFDTLII